MSDTTALPALDPRLAGYTGRLARQASLRAERLALAALPPGTKPREFAVLRVLAAEGPLSQARLGALLEVNRTVMISLIDGLESARLVRRERDPADRRRYALRLTDEGAAQLTGLTAVMAGVDRAIVAPLGPAGPHRLRALLAAAVPDLAATLPAVLADETGFLLARVAWRLRGLRERALRAWHIEPRCVGVLVGLDGVQPCTQERLAARLGVAGPTIVQVVDDLDRHGLITRERDPGDRRAHVLRLTPAGRDYLDASLRAEDVAQRELAAELGEAATAELNGLLTAMLADPAR
jgi:DNA-binding MarR family transcriptional regulator